MYGFTFKRSNVITFLWVDLIDITPRPILPTLKGLDQRVVGFVVVPGGMLVLGIIAAANVTADQANAQVHPGIADLQALVTALAAGFDLPGLFQVAAFI
jgi:hypothetical protein